MLERSCGTLLRSAEAFAIEAFKMGEETGRLYFLRVDRERTVMVVNSEHLLSFLKSLRLYG